MVNKLFQVTGLSAALVLGTSNTVENAEITFQDLVRDEVLRTIVESCTSKVNPNDNGIIEVNPNNSTIEWCDEAVDSSVEYPLGKQEVQISGCEIDKYNRAICSILNPTLQDNCIIYNPVLGGISVVHHSCDTELEYQKGRFIKLLRSR